MNPLLRNWVLARSPTRAAVVGGLVAAAGAVLITLGFELALGMPGHDLVVGLGIAAVAASSIAPPMFLLVARLIHELEQARLEAHRLAETDPLTGLTNRRRFADLLTRDVGVVRRAGADYSVMVIDVDGFKQVNDAHGHAAGDLVLVAVASMCKEALRATDVIARWGGDEFVVALPATGEAGAVDVAERLRAGVAEMFLSGRDKKVIRVTLSIGIATWGPGTQSVEALLHRADMAMYEAKHNGRDRVVRAQVEAAA